LGLILLAAASALAAAPAHAGSPLTLSILQDSSVKVKRLDVSYQRLVVCDSPDYPDIRTVTEKGTLNLGGKKSFYISEFSLVNKSQNICFVPAHTVTTSTGGETYTETIPAQMWNQVSQRLDITRVAAGDGSARVEVASACSGPGKLDSGKNRKVLKFRQIGALATSKSGKDTGKLDPAAEVKVSIECETTP
jgi:hypothetical protein